MRTTVDLPPAVYRRVQGLAVARGESLSQTIVDLTIRGLGQIDEPVSMEIDANSGFPVTSFGRRITSADVAATLDDE